MAHSLADHLTKLRSIDTDLWVAEQPLRLGPAQFGTRTTLVRLSDGGIWIHSPIALDEALRAEIEALGPVRYIVAPNKVHYFYVDENTRAFPGARLYLAPGLREKREELPAGQTLGEEAVAPWSEDLDQAFVEGWAFANETAFLHRKTQTLILTDLVFNLRAPRPLGERIALSIMGAYDRFGPSRLARITMRDRKAVRRGIDRILEWDFERVLIAHGELVEKGGRELLRKSYSFL